MIKTRHDLGSTPSRQVIRTGGPAQHQPGLDHHHSLLAPQKMHSALVHVIPATLLPATYNRFFSPEVKSPWDVHQAYPPFCITHLVSPDFEQRQSHVCGCLFLWGEKSTLSFPTTPLCVVQGPYLLPWRRPVLGGAGWFAVSLVLSNQGASAKFASHCFHAPLPNALNIVFNSPLCLSAFPEACGW